MRAGWSSRAGLVWAAAGSAVGFGNLLKFPAALERGGGAFLLIYLLFVVIFSTVGLPTEFAMGRRAGTGTLGACGNLLGHGLGVSGSAPIHDCYIAHD